MERPCVKGRQAEDSLGRCRPGLLSGRHVHHLRYPWGADRSEWKDDEHLLVEAPSLTVIPNTVIHTTQGIGPGLMRLVEVFAPPRLDFSLIALGSSVIAPLAETKNVYPSAGLDITYCAARARSPRRDSPQ